MNRETIQTPELGLAADCLLAMLNNSAIDVRAHDLPSIAANHAKTLITAVEDQQNAVLN